MRLLPLALAALLALPAAAQVGGDPMRQGPARGTLLGAEAGDAACYLRIRDEAGAVETWMAGFELCEAAPRLLNRRLSFAWTAANVLHPECQGRQDCGRSLRVMLVEAARE
jgi:hypothetical protein